MSYPTDAQAREEIIRVGRLLYEEGLNTGTDGNISCRVDGGAHLWTTGSGSAKGFLTEDDLVKTDLEGNVLEGTAKPSSELKLHLCVYRYNALAQAAVHAHSIAATALASAGVGLTEPLLPPVTLQLGKVTYQCVLNQKESEEIAALSSFIQQRLVTIEELEQQIRQLKQGEEEQDFLDAMF